MLPESHVDCINETCVEIDVKKDVGPSCEEHKRTLSVVGFSPWSFLDVYDQPCQSIYSKDCSEYQESHCWPFKLQ